MLDSFLRKRESSVKTLHFVLFSQLLSDESRSIYLPLQNAFLPNIKNRFIHKGLSNIECRSGSTTDCMGKSCIFNPHSRKLIISFSQIVKKKKRSVEFTCIMQFLRNCIDSRERSILSVSFLFPPCMRETAFNAVLALVKLIYKI